ncbi:hypothetical protein [Pyxidicoccus trucidator]|uniref:hypothetical protein n=1 Tax=Pyxidicoccus trucidator TaxID=2709662 RepID=UPI0013DAE003|nr:hypothetical protein [Pyxidicoccus trucidator]
MRASRWSLPLLIALVVGIAFIVALVKDLSEAKPQQAGVGDMASLAAQQLAELLSRQGIEASAQANTVRVGTRSLALSTRVTQAVRQEEQFLYLVGLEFNCQVDGAPVKSLLAGSVGIDPRQDGAVMTAIREWVGQYGFAIGRALASPNQPPPLSAAGFRVREGLTGVRGEAPGFKPDRSFHEQFLRHLEPVFRESFSKDAATPLHALTFTLVVGASPGESECRADGVVSAQLCERALSFPWPRGTKPYMFKQYYVLVPAEGQGG